jgi:sarcosine oxidase subunit alpha
LTADPGIVLEEGAQVMPAAGLPPPTRPIGHITSSYHSAILDRSIALALIAGGRSRMGQTLCVPTAAGEVAVEVSSPVFYDPQGARLNG